MRQIKIIAHNLSKHKLQPNESVAICLPNCFDAVCIMFACFALDIPVVIISQKLCDDHIRRVLDDTKPHIFISGPEKQHLGFELTHHFIRNAISEVDHYSRNQQGFNVLTRHEYTLDLQEYEDHKNNVSTIELFYYCDISEQMINRKHTQLQWYEQIKLYYQHNHCQPCYHINEIDILLLIALSMGATVILNHDSTPSQLVFNSFNTQAPDRQRLTI